MRRVPTAEPPLRPRHLQGPPQRHSTSSGQTQPRGHTGSTLLLEHQPPSQPQGAAGSPSLLEHFPLILPASPSPVGDTGCPSLLEHLLPKTDPTLEGCRVLLTARASPPKQPQPKGKGRAPTTPEHPTTLPRLPHPAHHTAQHGAAHNPDPLRSPLAVGWAHPKERRCPPTPCPDPYSQPILAVPLLHHHAGHALDALRAVVLVVGFPRHVLEVLHVGPHQHRPQLHEVTVGRVLHCRGAQGQGATASPPNPLSPSRLSSVEMGT